MSEYKIVVSVSREIKPRFCDWIETGERETHELEFETEEEADAMREMISAMMRLTRLWNR